jgi:hypothetical protein
VSFWRMFSGDSGSPLVGTRAPCDVGGGEPGSVVSFCRADSRRGKVLCFQKGVYPFCCVGPRPDQACGLIVRFGALLGGVCVEAVHVVTG